MKVAELWRYPVKSMQGERLDAADVTARGVEGDRSHAVVDASDGYVASAKNPRKWGDLLQLAARCVDDGVEVTLPDGATVHSNDPDVHARLSRALGREVRLEASAAEGSRYEMLFPNIEGLAPAEFVAATRVGDEDDGTLTRQSVAAASPAGTYFDVATLHLVTTATLDRAGADVRRFRPNVVIAVGDPGFVENDWGGSAVDLGSDARADVLMATMRCVMTTLPQPGLDADRALLRRLAADNRITLPGLGRWACAGVYASVTRTGRVAIGDPVTRSA